MRVGCDTQSKDPRGGVLLLRCGRRRSTWKEKASHVRFDRLVLREGISRERTALKTETRGRRERMPYFDGIETKKKRVRFTEERSRTKESQDFHAVTPRLYHRYYFLYLLW